ncbi:MAG: hypothetical protein IJ048_13030, partial [Clostridia bacterium]|nr:hypothetical protein [Clostridia bacterium]
MQVKSDKKIQNTLQNQRTRRQLMNLMAVLSVVIVIAVSFALTKPANTMTTICGLEEHTHSEACFTQKLICGLDGQEDHVHSDDCYERVLTCGKTEHTHTPACYPAATEEPAPEITEAPAPEPDPEPQTEENSIDVESETTNDTEEKTEDPIETEPIEDNTTEDDNQPTEDNQTEPGDTEAEDNNNTEEENTDEQKPDEENTEQENTDGENPDAEQPNAEQPDAEKTEDNTTEDEETASVKLNVSVEPEIVLPGQEAKWHFQAESEEKLALSWQLLKDGEEIKAGKFENEEKDYAFTPDTTGEYAFKLTATTVPEGEGEDGAEAKPVSKSKTAKLHVIEPPELAVSVTTEARSAFGGDAVSFSLSRSGNEYAQKAAATISAAQDGIIIYESNEYSDTITVTPVILEKAGIISVKVSLKDQFGQTAESSIELPCAMHETEGRDNWEYMFKDTELTGEWPKDFLTIAKTQIGYKESEKDFVIREDGELQGWTRYGAKAGLPYEEWCAMFASFCLDYAKVP